MRAGALVCAVVALALVAGVGSLRGNSGKAAKSDRVATLIKQLGDDAFATREAASKELVDIGEPALPALRKAATSSDDLEIRRRAERIIQAIATRAANAASKRQLAAFKGKWNVEFTNGVKERCQIRTDRRASVAEPLRTSNGKVEIKDGSVVIVYHDDRVERWTPVGKRMVVEHWHPGAPFPSGTPILGIADGAR
jgi:transposase